MTRGVCAKVNAILGGWLPEQRLFAKTDDRTRFVRLSPIRQIVGAAGLAAFVGWTGYLTAQYAVGGDLDTHIADADEKLVEIYEMRIARLEDERRRLADLVSETKAGMSFAAAEIAETHAALTRSLTHETALTATETSHRAQLQELAALQTATSNRCDALDADLAAMERDKAQMTAHLAASDAALEDLSAVLTDTAAARDAAETAATELSSEVAMLQSEFELRRDQQKRLMARLEDATRLSLGSFETVFDKTGVDIDNVLAEVRRDYSGSGGLFIPLDEDAGFDGSSLLDDNDASDEEAGAQTERVSALLSDMERISEMRVAVDRLPLARPVGAARFSSGFGSRRDPINKRKSFHAGVDFAAPRGTAIFAAGPGEVVFSGRQRGYGNLIKIRHAFGYETVYAHLNRRRVKVGDKVERGDRIGDMGNTGRSTGTHLHYEIRVNGKTVNPAKYIEAARNVL